MSHCHHSHSHTGKNLKIAIFLNFAFFVIELICGFSFNSKIILADALHDLGDVLTLSVSLILAKFARKKPTENFSYGFRRLSVVGAILNTAIILFGSYKILLWIYYEIRFPHTHPYVNIPGMFWVSVGGVLVNFLSVWFLHGSKNLLDRSVFTHLLEDLLGWILTFLTTILMWFTGIHQLDQIVSILILAIVSISAFSNAVRICNIFMIKTPSRKDLRKIKKKIKEVGGVSKIEKIHFWSLDGEHNVFTARIFAENPNEFSRIRADISRILPEFGVVDSTIEIIENKK